MVRYPLESFDEGLNVGPFKSEAAAEAFLEENPVPSAIESACTDEDDDYGDAYVCQLRSPVLRAEATKR